MVNHPNRGARPVLLTAEERTLILVALRIASEDGSIYRTEMTAAAQKRSDARMDAQLDAIEVKLRGSAA